VLHTLRIHPQVRYRVGSCPTLVCRWWTTKAFPDQNTYIPRVYIQQNTLTLVSFFTCSLTMCLWNSMVCLLISDATAVLGIVEKFFLDLKKCKKQHYWKNVLLWNICLQNKCLAKIFTLICLALWRTDNFVKAKREVYSIMRNTDHEDLNDRLKTTFFYNVLWPKLSNNSVRELIWNSFTMSVNLWSESIISVLFYVFF